MENLSNCPDKTKTPSNCLLKARPLAGLEHATFGRPRPAHALVRRSAGTASKTSAGARRPLRQRSTRARAANSRVWLISIRGTGQASQRPGRAGEVRRAEAGQGGQTGARPGRVLDHQFAALATAGCNRPGGDAPAVKVFSNSGSGFIGRGGYCDSGGRQAGPRQDKRPKSRHLPNQSLNNKFQKNARPFPPFGPLRST